MGVLWIAEKIVAEKEEQDKAEKKEGGQTEGDIDDIGKHCSRGGKEKSLMSPF